MSVECVDDTENFHFSPLPAIYMQHLYSQFMTFYLTRISFLCSMPIMCFPAFFHMNSYPVEDKKRFNRKKSGRTLTITNSTEKHGKKGKMIVKSCVNERMWENRRKSV